MKRSILSALVVAAFLAVTGSASAHVVTKAEVTCTGVTVSWTGFPGGSFDMNLAFDDSFNGGTEHVKSPYVVAHLSGASGTKFIPAPALNGVTFRKLLGTWTVDHGGSFTASVSVKPCNCQPTTTATTPGTTVTIPGQTVTTPGQTITTPGSTVTTPGASSVSTVTVTTPAVTVTTPAVTVTAPAVTTTTPGKTITKTVYRTRKPQTKIVYRPVPVNVKCPKGYVGTAVFPINNANKLIAGKPILAVCKKLPPRSVLEAGVAG